MLGSNAVAQTSEWYERVPWDDDMKEVDVEIPAFIVQLLKHNNLPATEDTLLCKDYQEGLRAPFTSVQTRIQSVISQIDAFQEELRKLEREKTGYAKQSYACDVACSPIRRLPLELVQEITYHLAQPRHHILFIHNPVMAMSQVCSSWRRALIFAPRLWTQFDIDTTNNARPHHQTNLKTAILEYSTRAQSMPLDIHVSLSDHDFRSTRHEHSHQFLSWLISEWPSINLVRHLHVTSFRFLDVLAHELTHPGAFESLERLILTFGRSMKLLRTATVFDVNTIWGDLFMNAPRLRRISIGKGSMGPFFGNLHFPFIQITHLCLVVPLTLIQWASLLEKLSALQFGFFYAHSHDPSEHLDVEHSSPCLENLTIHLEDFNAYSRCLGSVKKGRFPKLLRLEFVIESSENWSDENILPPSILGIPSLRNLSLFFTQNAPIDALLYILRGSPDVTTLELGLPASQWGAVLSALTLNDSDQQPHILPSLSTLVVQALVPINTLAWKGTYFDTTPCQEFIDMVQSRHIPPDLALNALGQRLQLLSVYLLLVQHPNYEVLAEGTREALLPCLEAGLSFQTRNLCDSLEDNRYNSCLNAHWERFIPELPPQCIPRESGRTLLV